MEDRFKRVFENMDEAELEALGEILDVVRAQDEDWTDEDTFKVVEAGAWLHSLHKAVEEWRHALD